MEQLIINRYGLRLAHFVAQATPPWLGYPIARFIASWLASMTESKLVRAVRANQWVVMGEKSTKKELEAAVHTVIQNIARSIYELYHYRWKPDIIRDWFVFDPSFQAVLDRPKFDQQGLILAGVHLSGFDLALQWACTNILEPLILTLPELGGVHKLEFEFRRKMGLNLVHGSAIGLRQSVRYLQQGGIVLTGIDRPVEGFQPQSRFFGRPSPLPNHHVFLALMTQSPLKIVVCRLGEDGKYHISTSQPIEMDVYPDRAETLQHNTEKILTAAEGFIRKTPQQWSATLPVWPDTLDLVPD